MRLIDADKIYNAVEQRYSVSSGIEHRCERDLLDLICEQPTVEVPQWIPVSDPPKETGHYLVSLHQEKPEGDLKDIVLDAWFQKEVFLFTSSEAGWHLLNEFYDLTPQLREYITHWMPLPEPAEVE